MNTPKSIGSSSREVEHPSGSTSACTILMENVFGTHSVAIFVDLKIGAVRSSVPRFETQKLSFVRILVPRARMISDSLEVENQRENETTKARYARFEPGTL